MEATLAKPTEQTLHQIPASGTAKRGRRGKAQEETARFFLAKEGSSPQKPELGEEAQTESDALIKAFQQKTGVIYVVTAFRAEAEIQGGSPILIKRPLTR